MMSLPTEEFGRNKMLDLNGEHVQVMIDGNQIWVSVGGHCALRCQAATAIDVHIDGRTIK